MTQKPANCRVTIDPLLARRFTTHAFDPERPIESEDRIALLEAARWAPSRNNLEPWRFVLSDRFAHPKAWQRVFEALNRGERPWAYGATLSILVAAELAQVDPAHQPRALFDCGGAALQLCLEATARRLVTHVTGAFDETRLRAALTIPEPVLCVALVLVGHPADLGTLGRDVYRREIAPRERAPFGSRCFEAQWGQALADPMSSLSTSASG